jgi:hypothetical protein
MPKVLRVRSRKCKKRFANHSHGKIFYTPAKILKSSPQASVKRSSNFGKDPDLRTVGERTYQAFASCSFSPSSDAPRQRDWRHIPYALWLHS